MTRTRANIRTIVITLYKKNKCTSNRYKNGTTK